MALGSQWSVFASAATGWICGEKETLVEMSRFTLLERGISGDTASCCSCIEYEDGALDIGGEGILSLLGRLLTGSGIDQIRSRAVYQQLQPIENLVKIPLDEQLPIRFTSL